MWTSLLRKMADVRNDASVSSKFISHRIARFVQLVAMLPRPVNILDVGGTPLFWIKMKLVGARDISISLLNLTTSTREHYPREYAYPNVQFIRGDARQLPFPDNEFDVVFSNSVIEHVGTLLDQRQMAQEVQRVSKRYFLQTPNFYCPVEPHFLFPCYQLLSPRLQLFLLRHCNLGWRKKTPDKQHALQELKSIRLLKLHELKALFPQATILKERMLGLTFSYVLHQGW